MSFTGPATFGFSGRRIPELDGIRGIAIFMVLVFHYVVCQIQTDAQGPGAYIAQALAFTWSGVDLFFVLSGFLIGGILLDNRQSPTYFKTFYIRRVCRIFPLYFMWLAPFLLIVHLIPAFSNPGEHPVGWLFNQSIPGWSYATFTQNFVMADRGTFGANWLGITWSLAVEEQFYIVLPFVIYFLPRRILPSVLVFCVAAAPILRTIFFYHDPNGWLACYAYMPCRADALLLGVLSALLVRQEFFARNIALYRKIFYAALAISFSGTLYMLYRGWSNGSAAMSTYGYSVLAIMYASLLLIAITEPHGLIPYITRNSYLRRLGMIAYGVYVFHQGVNGLVHAALLRQPPQIGFNIPVTLIALAATITLAYISWTWFEKPFIRFGHSYLYKSARKRPIQARTPEYAE